MFDIGFTELLVIGVVALIVIGPERLPHVARTVGHLVGRLQRYVSDVKADINREIELDELKKMRQSVEQTANGIESSLQAELGKTESELNQAAQSLAAEPAPDLIPSSSPTSAAACSPAPEVQPAPLPEQAAQPEKAA
jgi:sec-independent protein translocase protein TatB